MAEGKENQTPEKTKGPIISEELKRIMTDTSGIACEVEIPYNFRDPLTYRLFSQYQLIYSLAGLVLGLVCILGGTVLFLNGVVGSTSWTAKILGAESNISDAAPGTVLFIIGLFVVLVTRFNIKVKK
jgi:hypothetical protein